VQGIEVFMNVISHSEYVGGAISIGKIQVMKLSKIIFKK
jgi:hypothetical protein